MRRAATGIATLLLLAAVPLNAEAPDTSLRPVGRADPVAVIQADAAVVAMLRPQTRPQTRPQASDATASTETVEQAAALIAVARQRPHVRPVSPQVQEVAARPTDLPFLAPDTSPFPWARPDSIAEQVLFGRRKQRKGSVCGNIDIQGEAIGRVAGNGACGVEDAVRVRSVSGVALSQSAIMDCNTAQALNRWVEKGVKPAFRRRGPVVELRVAAHYVCRTRNSQKGARLSEHSKGKAIDISAFVMRDGEVITVEKGWGQGTTLKLLNKAWRDACGPFGTVLGPKADSYHRDHFHLDTASYRSGPYCK